MAFPYTFEANFEQGSNAEWDSESDTGSLLDFPHYAVLAKDPAAPIPYRGAYCMRVDLSGGDTNDHTVTEGDIDIADAGTAYFRWYMWVSNDFTATADDVFSIFELQQGGGTVEQTVGMQITAATGLLEIGVGDGTAPSSYVTFPRGRWVCVELLSTISTGGSGAMTLFLDGTSVIALTSLTQAAAVGQGVLGTQLTLATTTGKIYFDSFVMDEDRLYPLGDRYPSHIPVTKSGHVFVGPGEVDGAAIMSVTSGNTMELFDTDTADTVTQGTAIATMTYGSVTGVTGPFYFKRGCYVSLGGTNPRGTVYLMQASDRRGVQGPRYHSQAMIRHYAHRRKEKLLHEA